VVTSGGLLYWCCSGAPGVWLPTSCVRKAGDDGQYGSPEGTIFSDVIATQVLKSGIRRDRGGGGAVSSVLPPGRRFG
jgi:hypothetical protein